MKGIKLVILSVIVTAMLASCGTNNARNSAAPKATDTGNVSDTNNGKVQDDTKDTGMKNDTDNAAKDTGDAAKDVGDAAGNAVKDAGDAAKDAVDTDK